MNMSKQEILAWSQRIEEDEDEGDNQSTDFDWSTLFDNWSNFMLFSEREILSGSTKKRTSFLLERLVPLATRAGWSFCLDIVGRK